MRQPITKAAGLLYVVTAVVSGYWGLRFLSAPTPGPFPWAQMTLFGAPILLFVGGLLILFPPLSRKWLVAFAGIILLIFGGLFFRDVAKPYLALAAVVTLITWAVLGLASTLARPAIVAFVASLILALCWLPVPIGVFENAVSLMPPLQAAWKPLSLNAPLLVVWGLTLVASIVSAITCLRTVRA